MTIIQPSTMVQRARQHWRYDGSARPPFAEEPGADQESVWDYPRPPRIEPTDKPLRVMLGEKELARTTRGMRVLETAGAPTLYFPPEDVTTERLCHTGRSYHCEWKGISKELAADGVDPAGWVLTQAYPEFRELLGWYAFYPQELACFVGEERAGSQPGGYYGGWVTADIVGPIKGAPGSESW
ncbi:DUF427 domain-containing protein [Dichotomicrobium thermohalophilum]|uniref:Uncharacterized protein (DUF427 family) n=1 Tax=Dichotomicrobium thermohalophilum TaxID=933063 RepID=A0A397Q173_9HYPH|nr:DUF427 domain-containing protein [Dichotomicrobium thermohalophilum]RIA55260.1 uncharacterized protein (DUF427 family) [Dichotomicrobium thermohalophilum]